MANLHVSRLFLDIVRSADALSPLQGFERRLRTELADAPRFQIRGLSRIAVARELDAFHLALSSAHQSAHAPKPAADIERVPVFRWVDLVSSRQALLSDAVERARRTLRVLVACCAYEVALAAEARPEAHSGRS